jgi:hypothetical protein
MNRLGYGAAAALVTMATLAGCGGGSSSTSSGGYCTDVKTVQTAFANLQTFSLSQDSFATLVSTLPRIQRLAPVAVRDDWTTVANGVTTFNDALKKSGMTLDQAAKMGDGNMPGMDMSQMEPLMIAADSISARTFTLAADAIEKEVRTACNLDIGSSG